MSISSKTNGSWPLLILMLVISGACHTYYKANPARSKNSSETAESIDSLANQKRYFILRSGSYAWHMKNIILSEDRKTFSCSLDSVSYTHKLHFSHGRKRKMQYAKNRVEDMGVINEV